MTPTTYHVFQDLIVRKSRSVAISFRILSPLKSLGSHGNVDGKFTQPHGVAVSNTGQVIFSDSLKHRIHVFTPDGGQILEFGSEGTKDGKLFHLISMTLDKSQKYVFVANSDNNRVQYFDLKTGSLWKSSVLREVAMSSSTALAAYQLIRRTVSSSMIGTITECKCLAPTANSFSNFGTQATTD